MKAEAHETIVDNTAFAKAKPVLSVLIPYLCDDPRPLLGALERAEGLFVGGKQEIPEAAGAVQ